MDKTTLGKYRAAGWLSALLIAFSAVSSAQVPVDAAGNEIAAPAEEIPLLSAAELAELVGPIALYPDDLLAIVLPASTYPLQLVQAERFLQDLKNDPTLKPDDDWDDSVVALLNYPEAVELLTDELDRTWRLGEAVVAQQADVIAAVEAFRDRAYAAGNLQSDAHQNVSQNDGVIEITPVEDDVIYVPYYEPERVVVYQPQPVYHYYPRPYPVYYYPYPYGYAFNTGFFWGVTTAFTVGWYSDSLYVYHHSYYGHPYYGHSYWDRYWYRRPDVHVYNNYYYGGHSHDYRRHGDHWRPHSASTVNPYNQRVTRNRQYAGTATRTSSSSSSSSQSFRPTASQPATSSRSQVRFREREATGTSQARRTAAHNSGVTRATTTTRTASSGRTSKTASNTPEIKFRERSTAATGKQAASVRPQVSARQPARSSQPTLAQRSSSELKAARSPTRQVQARRSETRAPSQDSHFSQPARASQPTRASQPSHFSQPSRASQPSRPSQPSRASQPSRSSQPSRASEPSRSRSENSGSGKVKVASANRHGGGNSRDRH